MAVKPRDVKDLFLAPVVLGVEENIQTLAKLSRQDITLRVALETDMRLDTPEAREKAFVKSATHLVDMHGWEAELTPRGIRIFNGEHSITLGINKNIVEFLD